MLKEGSVPVEEFIELPEIKDTFDSFLLSDSRFGEDVRVIE